MLAISATRHAAQDQNVLPRPVAQPDEHEDQPPGVLDHRLPSVLNLPITEHIQSKKPGDQPLRLIEQGQPPVTATLRPLQCAMPPDPDQQGRRVTTRQLQLVHGGTQYYNRQATAIVVAKLAGHPTKSKAQGDIAAVPPDQPKHYAPRAPFLAQIGEANLQGVQ